MAANLLSSLYHEIIQADQMQKGFKSLLNSVDDLKLDVPSAEDDLALFLARGVIDDILPPAFLHKLPCGEPRSSSYLGYNTYIRCFLAQTPLRWARSSSYVGDNRCMGCLLAQTPLR